MFVFQKIRKAVSKIDMFSSSEIFRYGEDAHYYTFTGGLITLGITFTVIAGFFSMISETLSKSAISSNVNTLISSDPLGYNVTTKSDSNFMFGIQLKSSNSFYINNFSAPTRYFNLFAQRFVLKYGVKQVQEPIPLVPCTDEHWKMLPDVVQNKKNIKYNTWVCPALDSQYLLQGRYFSDVFGAITITVQKCTNDSDPSRPCRPQSEIDDLFARHGNFYFSINYVNTVVNPGEVDYLTHYLQNTDYSTFSANIGTDLRYFFSDYEIETDTSILPFSNYQYDRGLLLPQKVSAKTYVMGSSSNYAIAYFNKAAKSLRYRRQVQKLSVVISYIGGLVGAISTVLFILRVYTDISLEISIATSIFQITPNQPQKDNKQSQCASIKKTAAQQKMEDNANQQKTFNIFKFIKLFSFKLLKNFKFTESWTESKQIEILREQVGKHLDAKILLKRLTNLQRCLSYLYDDDQLKCLKYLRRISLDEVKTMRTIFSNEPQQEQQFVEQTQSTNQLYTLQNNNEFSKRGEPKNSQFQMVSPELLSRVINNDNSSNRKNNHMVTENTFPQNKFSQAMFNKKMMSCFSNIQKTKETDALSKKIWQNLNGKIKEDFASSNSKKMTFKNISQSKKKSYFQIEQPTDIIEKIN